MIIAQNDLLFPIEIKTSGHATADMAKNFSVLKNKESLNMQTGAILCRCDRNMLVSDSLQALPIEWI